MLNIGFNSAEFCEQSFPIFLWDWSAAIIHIQPVMRRAIFETECYGAVFSAVSYGIFEKVSEDGLKPDLAGIDGNGASGNGAQPVVNGDVALLNIGGQFIQHRINDICLRSNISRENCSEPSTA